MHVGQVAREDGGGVRVQLLVLDLDEVAGVEHLHELGTRVDEL